MQNPVPDEYRFITTVAVSLLIIGMVFYHFVQQLSWLDAIYFSVTTLATVGYGDIIPKTPLEKIFTIFYILIGIGVIAAFANSVVKRASARRKARLQKKQK
jgi:voltage-gated potassium channel